MGSVVGGLFGGGSAAQEQAGVSNSIFRSLSTPLGSFGASGGQLDRRLNRRSRDLFDLQARQSFLASTRASPTGSALGSRLAVDRSRGALQNFSVEDEIDRLRQIARPEEDRLRESLRSRSINNGRLGIGVGGGVTGGFFNPEIAAQEEAFARADLLRVDAARNEEQRLLGNLFNSVNLNDQVVLNNQAFGNNAITQRVNTVNGALLPLAQLGAPQAFSALQQGANTQASTNAAFGAGLGGIFDSIGGALFSRGSGGAATQQEINLGTGFDIGSGRGFFGSGFDSAGGL